MIHSTVDLTSAWLGAIDRATACLRAPHNNFNNNNNGGQRRGRGGFQQQRGPRSSSNFQNNHHNMMTVEDSLRYLVMLENVLLEHQLFWDQPPTIAPPEWMAHQQQQQQQQLHQQPNQPHLIVPAILAVPQQYHAVVPQPSVITPPLGRYYMESNQAAGAGEGTNPFATFQSDGDDDEEDDEDENNSFDDVDEAGDQPMMNYIPSSAGTSLLSSAGTGMVLRRVMIRVVTALSELYAHKASACRQERPPKWKEGAETYGLSLFKIHQALQLADSEISRLIEKHQAASIEQENGDWIFQDLVEDANIVEVAIQYLTQERDRFRQAALQQEQYLLKRLNPQWQARDQARARMGDKWVQNPNPKNEFWHRRRQDEYQLRDIQEALAQLNQVDTGLAEANSKKLKKRLKQQRHGGAGGLEQQDGIVMVEDENNNGNPNNNIHDTIRDIGDERDKRYNRQRPLDYSRRVSWEDYPDPTNHGWTFTGSWEPSLVEFFERAFGADGEVVKLDWYYTTATMKTSLHHPTQGKTQMFAKRITPAVYLEILRNPRSHTNQRYQTRNRQPNNNSNNSSSNNSQRHRQTQQQQQQQRR